MEQPNDKAALVDWLRREKAYWEALLSVIPAADMLLPGAMGEWTFKDAVAHLTGWRKLTLTRISGGQQGGDPRPADWPADLGDDTQVINEWIHRTNQERSLVEVLAESQQVWEQLLNVVAAAPEAELMGPARYEWLAGQPLGPTILGWSFQHLHEHAAMIDDWLARLLDERLGAAA